MSADATNADAANAGATGADARGLSWQRRSSDIIADCRVFRVRRDVSVSPHRGSEHDFFVLESSDWINIIPLTAAGEVVMIEQYRHGSEEVTLEIPGGMVDAGESPQAAAVREMLEETGYAATGEVVSLGKVRPNPAIHNNWIHTFLARDVSLRQKPVIESTEHTVVRLVALTDIPRLIRDGSINHALVVVGFHWLALSGQHPAE